MATPVKSSAADRRRPTFWDAVLAAGVLALALALAFLLAPKPSADAQTLVIQQENRVLAVYDLSTITESVVVEVPGPYPLTVTLSSRGAAVTTHSCPGGDCAGNALTAGTPGQLVCLPNRTVVTLSGTSPLLFDAVTG